jgi:protein TonB
MFSNLLESRSTPTGGRTTASGALSFVTHLTLVSSAVLFAGDRATFQPEPFVERVVFASSAMRFASAPPRGDGVDDPAVTRAPRAARHLVGPRSVPKALPPVPEAPAPDVDVTDASLRRDIELGLIGIPQGSAFLPRATGTLRDAIAEFTWRMGPHGPIRVEQVVVPFADNPLPEYPASLRTLNIEGEVLIEFVVDTTGLADVGSLRVIRSSHELFTRAVKKVLPRLHFIPAQTGQRKVAMVVEQPFSFHLRQESGAFGGLAPP